MPLLFSEMLQFSLIHLLLAVPVGFLFGLIFGFFWRMLHMVGGERYITSSN